MIVHVYHVHIVCGYGMRTSSNESETITNRGKKNTDCEKKIVIVNLYRTVTVEYYFFMSVNGAMWLSLKLAIMFSGMWYPCVHEDFYC